MKTIAYQGEQGAYSYLTAVKAFGEEPLYIGMRTFKEVFDLLHNGQADYAVIPIENSLVGSIYENYDLLNRYEAPIIAEHYTKIEHCLLAAHAVPLKNIKKVFSHPKALEQCKGFFSKHPWMEAIAYWDTAGAAAEIAERSDPDCAAIASAQAGKIYKLNILKDNIEDDPQNYTRFVTIAKRGRALHQADKISLSMHLKHAPGSLAKVLNKLGTQGMNLSKIESRPLKGSPFEYIFYVDFEFHGQKVEEVLYLLSELKSEVELLKILGFYKAARAFS